MVRPPTAQRLAFLQREDGQDSFEYMLLIGGLSVAMVVAVALLAFGLPSIRTATCGGISAVLSGYSGCNSGSGAAGLTPAGGQSAGGSGSPSGVVQPTVTPSPQCAPGQPASAPDCVRR
jgi:hypothetical protein